MTSTNTNARIVESEDGPRLILSVSVPMPPGITRHDIESCDVDLMGEARKIGEAAEKGLEGLLIACETCINAARSGEDCQYTPSGLFNLVHAAWNHDELAKNEAAWITHHCGLGRNGAMREQGAAR